MTREIPLNNGQPLGGATMSTSPNGSSAIPVLSNSPQGISTANGSNPGLINAPQPALLQLAPTRELYSLLPAIYRVRDAAQGEQLRALIGIIESELQLLESNIEALYENGFIETCDEWVVPYIGDLLAVRDLNAANPRSYGQERRAYVAHTLAYRQRKGTTPVLEQLARDITGWGARAQEMLPLVATTQTINHVRSQNITVDLRGSDSLKSVGTPFEIGVAHTTEISRTRSDRGQYSPTSVALYLWRLQVYQVENGTPRAVEKLASEPQGYYFTFNPLGLDETSLKQEMQEGSIPLFNPPQTETEITTLAQEINVPGKLTQQLLEQWLQTYAPDQVPVQVFVKGQRQTYRVADLRNYQPKPEDANNPVVDPERGRLVFFSDQEPTQVEVSYHYGFSGNVGAGTYERPNAVTELPPRPNQVTWKINASEGSNDLEQAVKTWNRYSTRWQRCYDLVYLPVAKLLVSDLQVRRVDDKPDSHGLNSDLSPTMKPGILHGLQVVAQRGEIDAVVLPGVAVDAMGQSMQLQVRYPILVGCYPNQWVQVMIWRPQKDWEPHWQIIAIPEDRVDRYPDSQYIRLVRLRVDGDGRIAESNNRVRSMFSPGFSGQFSFTITRTPEGKGNVSLTASPNGFAVNRDGQKIPLKSVGITVESLTPQTFLVFLRFDPQTKEGKLDAVPDFERVIIELQGNHTYQRNLALQIPAERQLYLIASNGDCPHLLGNLRIRGMATPRTENAGDFYLEGVLVEGGLTVLPGNLQRLQLAHTTLVPQGPGLVVQKAEYEIVDENMEDVTLLALLMYGLTLLRRLIRVGLTDNGLSAQERITQLTQITQQQIMTLFEGIHRVLQQWQCPPPRTDELEDDEDNPEPAKQGCATLCQNPDEDAVNLDEDNSLLAVTIDRSICGAISLADTVPELRISESIIDAGRADLSRAAVDARGADMTLTAATLLGTLTARSLDAENSILHNKVNVALRQRGCLRFCYVPEGSRTPRRHRCQPDLLLTERLGELPAAIATLTVHPDRGQVYAGTRGKGVLQFVEAGEIWVPLNAGLSNLNVTVLLAIGILGSGTVTGTAGSRQLTGSSTQFTQELKAGDTICINKETYWVLEVTSDQKIRLGTPLKAHLTQGAAFIIDALFAGTTNGRLFRAVSQLQTGLGTITASPYGTELRGTATFFTQDVVPGDDILLLEQATDVTVRDARTVTAVTDNLVLTLNARLTDDRANQSFLVRRRVWIPVFSRADVNTRINAIVPFPISDPTYAAAKTTGLLIGTAGSGIFQSADWGNTWTDANQGVINLDIRAIAYHSPTERLLAGSWGNGILFSTDNGFTWKGGDPADPAVRQTGLSTPDITSLLVNPVTQDIFAGTAGGGVFRSTDGGDHWVPANQGLTRSFITTLAEFTQAGSGTLSSRYNEVIGAGTQFKTEFSEGDLLTLNGQSRTILDIRSDTSLLLNDAFDPDIPAGTSFQVGTLLAGTIGGAVFRSTSNGRSWTLIGELTRTDLAGFAIQRRPNDPSKTIPTVFAGTQIGSLYRSTNRGDRWTATNHGIQGMEEALMLLNQMQPRFTAERYGLPAYAQLSTVCPIEIRTGAEDGAEMGAFNYLKQPQREANLQASLREYLRFGLQTDTIFIT